MQETHLLAKDTHRLRSKHFPQQFWSSGPSKRNGVAILIGAHFPGKIIGVTTEIKGRLLAIRIYLGSTYTTLATLFAPNAHQEPFIIKALSHVLTSPDSEVLIGGDFNLVMNSDLDRSAHRSTRVGAFSLQGLHWLADNDLQDVWRAHHPGDKDYTFYSAAHKSYARLDHFLATSPPSASCDSCHNRTPVTIRPCADIHPNSPSAFSSPCAGLATQRQPLTLP